MLSALCEREELWFCCFFTDFLHIFITLEHPKLLILYFSHLEVYVTNLSDSHFPIILAYDPNFIDLPNHILKSSFTILEPQHEKKILELFFLKSLRISRQQQQPIKSTAGHIWGGGEGGAGPVWLHYLYILEASHLFNTPPSIFRVQDFLAVFFLLSNVSCPHNIMP